MHTDERALQPISSDPQELSILVQEMMGPLVEAMGKLLERNNQALQQLAATQAVQNDRLEALEKQIRLNTPVTPQMVRYMNDAIKARARELLQKREIEDAMAIRKLGNHIRKGVLSRYGVSALAEIPRHEYSVAMGQIGMWNDAMKVFDVVKEARNRAEIVVVIGQPAGVDGEEAPSGQVDQ